MEEIVLSQATQALNQRKIIPAKKQPNFKEQLMSFLLTQYGLPRMADKYFNDICYRITWYAQSDQSNKYAQIIMDIINQKISQDRNGDMREIIIQTNFKEPTVSLNSQKNSWNS